MTRVPATELTGLQGSLLKAAVRKKLGKLPESIGVMWNHPQVFKDMMRAGGRTEKWDRLDPNLGAFAVMAAAAEIGCGACLDLNYFMAHHRGLAADKAQQVPGWRHSTAFSELERRVMAYAEAMCRTPLEVTDELAEALRTALGNEAFVELTMIVALENQRSRFNSALGLTSQGFKDRCELKR